MVTEADFRKWEKENRPETDKEKVEQATQKRMSGVAMSQIKSDPRWKLYADHLVGLCEALQGRAAGLGADILDKPGSDVVTLKQERLKITGKIEGINTALHFIEVLIDQGEDAAKKMKEEENG